MEATTDQPLNPYQQAKQRREHALEEEIRERLRSELEQEIRAEIEAQLGERDRTHILLGKMDAYAERFTRDLQIDESAFRGALAAFFGQLPAGSVRQGVRPQGRVSAMRMDPATGVQVGSLEASNGASGRRLPAPKKVGLLPDFIQYFQGGAKSGESWIEWVAANRDGRAQRGARVLLASSIKTGVLRAVGNDFELGVGVKNVEDAKHLANVYKYKKRQSIQRAQPATPMRRSKEEATRDLLKIKKYLRNGPKSHQQIADHTGIDGRMLGGMITAATKTGVLERLPDLRVQLATT